MNAQVQVGLPAILAVRSEIGALRAEMRQGFAELELRLTKQIWKSNAA
jgi:hypothetical protein